MNANAEHFDPNAESTNQPRRRALSILLTVFALLASGWFIWWWLVLSRRETTTDAYVAGNQIAVTTQVAGTVVSLHTDDTQRVEAGQELVRLDATDSLLQLQRATATLTQAVRNARQLSATAGQFDAVHQQRRLELQWAEQVLLRRQPLLATQAVAIEEVKQAESGVQTARAALQATERQALAAHAQVGDLEPEAQPAVADARAAYEQAWINVRRHRVLAPAGGYVARRTVQAGQRLQAGETLLTIVQLDRVWVDANFKESQLRALRLGQSADVSADIYGSDVHYRGRIVGMAAGTGSAFSLLPAQNATGNWVKVVQRVPVRIAIEPQDLQKYPLRIGLSLAVTVGTTDRSGALLPVAAATAEVAGALQYEGDAAAAHVAAEAVLRGAKYAMP